MASAPRCASKTEYSQVWLPTSGERGLANLSYKTEYELANMPYTIEKIMRTVKVVVYPQRKNTDNDTASETAKERRSESHLSAR
jgi:hypothetical protein